PPTPRRADPSASAARARKDHLEPGGHVPAEAAPRAPRARRPRPFALPRVVRRVWRGRRPGWPGSPLGYRDVRRGELRAPRERGTPARVRRGNGGATPGPLGLVRAAGRTPSRRALDLRGPSARFRIRREVARRAGPQARLR